MAFCNMCGRQLREGEVCNCQSQGYAGQNSINMSQNNYNQQANLYGNVANNNILTAENTKNIVGSVWKQILEIIKSPVTYGKEYVFSGNVITAVILIALQAFMSGMFALFNCVKIQSLMEDMVSASLGNSSMSDRLAALSIAQMPIAKGFFLTFLFSLIFTFILAGLVFLGNKLIKNDITFINAMLQVSLRSLFIIFVTAFSIIIMIINPFIAIITFYLGGFLGVILMFITAPINNKSKKDILFYIMVAVCIIFVIVNLFIMSKCWTIYLPKKMSTLFNQYGDL